jgi:periplasmic divalent cation tolerance protein
MEKFEDVRTIIRRLHSYQVPEIIALPIAAGDPAYLSWLTESLRAKKDSKDKKDKE